MKSNPEVSVIIPLFNKGLYIRRTLNSVFAQTFKDYEVIIVDDGSTDDGPEKVMAYADSRLRLIHQANAGPGAARNRGIGEAQGKYVTFLDADDEWLPEFLKKSYDILEKNKDCDVCVSAWFQDSATGDRIYEGKSIVEVYNSINIDMFDGIVDSSKLRYEKFLLHMWCSSTVFIRRCVFLKKYRFYDDTNYTYGEDHFLWIQLAFNHKFYRNCEPLAWYHNNVSELAYGGYVRREIEAFLLWPEKIIEKTESRKRKIVRKWLVKYALSAAHSRLGVGQYDNALILIKKFPDMIVWAPIFFFKLLVKLLLYNVGIYRPCPK